MDNAVRFDISYLLGLLGYESVADIQHKLIFKHTPPTTKIGIKNGRVNIRISSVVGKYEFCAASNVVRALIDNDTKSGGAIHQFLHHYAGNYECRIIDEAGKSITLMNEIGSDLLNVIIDHHRALHPASSSMITVNCSNVFGFGNTFAPVLIDRQALYDKLGIRIRSDPLSYHTDITKYEQLVLLKGLLDKPGKLEAHEQASVADWISTFTKTSTHG